MKFLSSRKLQFSCGLTALSLPIGVVASYLFLALSMGSFQDAFGLILASIICTLGITLIIWIPIWFVTGYIVLIALQFILYLFGVDMDGPLGPKPSYNPHPPRSALSKDQLALLNYIKKARAKGLSDEQISNNLTSNGWKANSITAVFQMVEGSI